jgi:hypothetical protein
MQQFLDSMSVKAIGIPFWVWLIAILAVSIYVGSGSRPKAINAGGGDACSVLAGGRNC